MEIKKGAQKVKRASPAFARTARGCKMCRTRRKKCDEEYSASGACGRCTKGGFQCDGPGVSAPTHYTARQPPQAPRSQPALPLPLPPSAIQPFTPHPPSLPPAYPTIFPVFPSTSPAPPSYPHPSLLAFPCPSPMLPLLNDVDQAPCDPPLLADSAHSPSLQSFFDSLRPAVDPSAFLWTDSPIIGGLGSPRLSVGGQVKAIAAQGVASRNVDPELSEDALNEAQAVPIYAALSDAFLSSLPPPVRDIVKRRLMDVAFSNDLSKSASIALCLLYQARTLPDGDQARERLIQQSSSYFDRAATKLATTTAIPLEAQILATLDLFLHALESSGAAAGYSVLLLADHWITSSLGRPQLDLTTLEGINNILFRSIAHIDILRCLSLGNRRTLFNLVGTPGSSPLPSILSSNPAEVVSSEACEGTKGAPTGLLLCIAATCNLSVEEARMDKSEFRRQGEEIERRIKGWKPVVITPEKLAGEEGIKVLDDFATHEMWRYAALINLYQSVFHYGPLQPSIRTSRSQLLAFGSRHSASIIALDSPTTPTTYEHLPTCGAVERACPWIFAATAAIDLEDRKMCREAIGLGRPLTLAQSNLAAAERLWELSDEQGWPVVDWRSALAREGRYVAFL